MFRTDFSDTRVRRRMLFFVGAYLAMQFLQTQAAERAGSTGNRQLPFLMASDFDYLDLVAWRVEQGREDSNNPLLEPEMPWDAGGVFAHGTVLRDPIDGLWKAWQVSTPLSEQMENPNTWRQLCRLTYLESEDEINWKRPELSFVQNAGYEKTNILMETWSSYASVNIDPKRPWPYEMFVFLDPLLFDNNAMTSVIERPFLKERNHHV